MTATGENKLSVVSKEGDASLQLGGNQRAMGARNMMHDDDLPSRREGEADA